MRLNLTILYKNRETAVETEGIKAIETTSGSSYIIV